MHIHMITVPQKVEEIIGNSPYLEQALAENLINLSSLARKIKPQIEKDLFKDVTEASIVMALKRFVKVVGKKTYSEDYNKYFGDITVRSNLIEFAFVNSPSLTGKIRDLMTETPDDVFLTWTRGIYETTIIVSRKMAREVGGLFRDEVMKYEGANLSSITIKLPEQNIFEPGVYYTVLKKLAWEGININEVISTYTELTIILASNDVDRAFSALKG